MNTDPDNGPQANHEAPLLARIQALEGLLRSACAIADRKGVGTAWDRFLASAADLGINGITARTYRHLQGIDYPAGKFTFGQLVINPWASDDNPTKRGYFVRIVTIPSGQCNSGTLYECTDGKGKFWQSREIHSDD